ncbi:MAG: hypothetical protein AB8B81_01115 [Halioglobus sp.]
MCNRYHGNAANPPSRATPEISPGREYVPVQGFACCGSHMPQERLQTRDKQRKYGYLHFTGSGHLDRVRNVFPKKARLSIVYTLQLYMTMPTTFMTASVTVLGEQAEAPVR